MIQVCLQRQKTVITHQSAFFSEDRGKLDLQLHYEGFRPACSLIHVKSPVCLLCRGTMPSSRDAFLINIGTILPSLSLCFGRETDVKHLFILWLAGLEWTSSVGAVRALDGEEERCKVVLKH